MAGKRSTKAETDMRVNEFARKLANGARRFGLCQYAADEWGVSSRQADRYIAEAYKVLKSDYDIDRSQMVANLLSQTATLQQEARTSKNLSVALGCINTAAKLAQLVS